ANQVEGALSNKGGGILSQGGKEYPLRILVAPASVAELNNLTLGKSAERVIRLSEVAELREGASPIRGTASIDGRPGVILRIIKQPAAETLTVTKAIDETIASLKKSLPAGVDVQTDLFRQEWFIHSGLTNVLDALRDGTILVIVILMIFLFNWRTTTITLVAIPLSILVTAIIFRLFGFSVNVMTLGGIAVAVGELVDDAIVDVENVYRRIGQWRVNGKVAALGEVVFKASSEVRNSIIYATAIVAVVFVPIFFIPGVEGKLLAPLGLAYIVSLTASLLVSLTVTPALCVLLLGSDNKKQHGDTKVVLWLKQVLSPGISWSINNPKIMIVGLVLSLLTGGALYVTAANEGIPNFNEDAMTI
ncbi:MAG TPA: efflux RND transporter permease subunit, partial [bacterium]|nr:efflux RND transporter permease subunit [bacterium]